MSHKDVSPRGPRDDETLLNNQGDTKGACNPQAYPNSMLNAFSSGDEQDDEEEAMELFGPEGAEEDNGEELLGHDDFETPTCEEGGVTKPKRHPGDPTKEEVDEHELTHCAYRSWCPIYVESQGKEDPHYRATGEDTHNEASAISMDYKELSEHVEAKSQFIIVVCRDKWTKDVAAMVVRAKVCIECSK